MWVRSTKLLLYRSLIFSVLRSDATALKVFKGKILLKIYGSPHIGNDFRIRMNKDLFDILKDLYVIQCNNSQRMSWLGHVVRMEKHVPVKRIFDAGIRGRPCPRWKDQMEKIFFFVRCFQQEEACTRRDIWYSSWMLTVLFNRLIF